MKKWILSVFLAAIVCLFFVPASAYALDGTEIKSDSFTDGSLTLSTGSYYLGEDVTGNIRFSNTDATDAVLDLNGHVLKGTGNGSVIEITSTSAKIGLTLKDSNPNEVHTGNYDSLPAGGVITCGNANYGGGVNISNGAAYFTMEGGTITGNTVSEHGGGVAVGNGTAKFTMNGGTITGNTATKNGGGVAVLNVDSVFEMNGGNIKDNTAQNGGGVFVYHNNAAFNMNGGMISGNNATYGGGGVFANDTTRGVKMSGGTICNNNGGSLGWGGGVNINAGCGFTMTGGKICENIAQNGGGMFVGNDGASFTMTGGSIEENTCTTGEGGGVHVNNSVTVNVTLGGTAKIAGNKKGSVEDAVTQNLYLASGKTITIGTGDNAPASGMSVGVSMEAGTGSFTDSASQNDSSYFFADNDECMYRHVNNHLELVKCSTMLQGALDGTITESVYGIFDIHDNKITLLKDIKFASSDTSLSVTGTKTLDLNGYVINVNGGAFSAINVGSDAILNLYDSGNTEHKGYTDANGIWHIGEKSPLEDGETAKSIYGGIITGVKETKTTNECAIHVNGGTLNMYDGNIAGNYTEHGTVIVENSGSFVMSGGEITGNWSNNHGGGVSVYVGTLTMKGTGIITGNKVNSMGAGVYIKNGTFEMSEDSQITKNIAGTYGGGVRIDSGTFTMSGNSKISYNEALSAAGGVNVQGSCTFNMNGGSIDHNKASGNNGCGGGVHVLSGTLNMNGGKITGNTADTAGGGIFDAGTVNLGGNSDISGNVVGGVITDTGLTGGTTNNIYLYNKKYITIGTGSNGVAVPTTGFKAGVSTSVMPQVATPVAITLKGSATDVSFFSSDDSRFVVAYTSTGNCLELKNVAFDVTFDMKGHGSQVDSQTVAKGYQVTEPTAPTESGYTFGGWYKETSCTNVWNFENDTVTDNITLYAKWTSNYTPGPSPNPGPNLPPDDPKPTPKADEPLTEDYKVPVESDTESVQISAKIEDGIAAVEEITEEALEEIIVKKTSEDGSTATGEAAETVTIDLSKANQDVTGAELSKKSVENLAGVVNDKTNNVDTVVIKMKDASVELDAKTLETLHDNMAGDALKIVIDKTEEKTLNKNQQKTLGNYDVTRTFEAYFESNGEKIHDFNGGNVKVSISFTPEKGKKTKNYKVYYLDDNGKLQKYATKYENGKLTFVTSHFSDYVIIYDNTKDVLLAQAATTKKGNIKLSWNRIEGAQKYVVYGASCGKAYKKLTQTDKAQFTIKKISGAKPVAGKTYKLYVVAYDALGNKIKSKAIHYIAGNSNGKYGNVETITASEKSLELSKGEKANISVKYTMYDDKKHVAKNHGKALRYTSDCPEVAKVSSNGTITAKGVGKAVIYIQDITGKWCQVEVTVK